MLKSPSLALEYRSHYEYQSVQVCDISSLFILFSSLVGSDKVHCTGSFANNSIHSVSKLAHKDSHQAGSRRGHLAQCYLGPSA